MRRLRSTLAVIGFVGACRALPSAIPLADTGEGHFAEDGALGRNRVPLAQRAPGSDEADDLNAHLDETMTVVASLGDAGDAGVPEAGTAAGDAGPAGLWAGEYFGSDRQTTRLEGKPEKVELDDKAHTRVEEPSAGLVLVSLVSSGDGSVICGMRARVTGNRAEVEPGETCPGLYLMPPLAIHGSAKLDGDELEFDVEGHGEFPADDEPITMDVAYHFEGKRR